MRKGMIAAVRLRLLPLPVLLLILAGGSQTAQGQDNLTLEGEWIVVSSSVASEIGGTYTIARKGDGYSVTLKQRNGPGPPCEGCGLFYGTPSQIMSANTLTYNDLVFEMPDSGRSAAGRQALRELAGKYTRRDRITLSQDGRSADYVWDGVHITYETDTGHLAKYEVLPFSRRATLERARPAQTDQGSPTPAIAAVVARGEFYILTKDGRKLTGKDVDRVPCEDGARVVTGSDGRVQLVLPDATVFTIGANSEIEVDSFVYETPRTVKAITIHVTIGLFRWVTGKVNTMKPGSDMKVRLPVGDLGIRGTDFEVTVNPDGTGLVVLHFGQLEITEKKTGFKFILDEGYKVTFGADGSISRPIKMD